MTVSRHNKFIEPVLRHLAPDLLRKPGARKRSGKALGVQVSAFEQSSRQLGDCFPVRFDYPLRHPALSLQNIVEVVSEPTAANRALTCTDCNLTVGDQPLDPSPADLPTALPRDGPEAV